MKEFNYIEDRLDEQIKWYSGKSKSNQKSYKRLQLFQIALAVSIPIMTLLLDQYGWVKYIIAIVGGLIAFVEGIDKVYNFRQLWTKYRIASEALKKEKILYDTKSFPYNETDNLNELIVRCERIMSNENSSWIDLQAKKENRA